MNFEFSKHALEQMIIRDVSKDIVMKVLENPDEIKQEDGMSIYQSIIPYLDEGNYLIRVFVNSNKIPNLIVPVYKTSKISKYYEGKI